MKNSLNPTVAPYASDGEMRLRVTAKTESKEEKTYSLLSIKLNTGRFHQIRTQLASKGMPIFADGKYGSREKAPYLALWANKLAFSFKDKHYEFETDPEWDETPWNMFNK